MPDLNKPTNSLQLSDKAERYIRPRINALLEQAVQKPLVIVCAGVGYGKTDAVLDFVNENKIPAVWIQCSEFDNVSRRFWENFIHALSPINKPLSNELKELGLPDSEDKLNRYLNLSHHSLSTRPAPFQIYVLDDLHLIKNPAIIYFLEGVINNWPKRRSVILICRNLPEINIANLQAKGLVQFISDSDLNFNEKETKGYLQQMGVSVTAKVLHEILKDTKGWPLTVSFVARSLKNSPGYWGYVRNAMKQNVFKLLEADVWDNISENLQRFLIRLSLIDHLATELITSLSQDDVSLLSEFKRENAYIRYDSYIDAYLIHNLFLDFLGAKQVLLTDAERGDTYRIAAKWCEENDFIADALNYYEKSGDYESITAIFFRLFSHLTYDLALYSIGLFERAAADIFDRVEFFAVMHIYTLICLGRWQDFFSLAKYYEKKFLQLPEDNVFRNHTLAGIYYFYGNIRILMSITDDRYDFDVYYAKAIDYLTKAPRELVQTLTPQLGSWVIAVGTERQGAPQEYIETASRMVKYAAHYIQGLIGWDDLCRGELAFYQGKIKAAESYFLQVLAHTRGKKQFETNHKALFYLLRIAVLQGAPPKIDQLVHDLEQLPGEEGNARHFILHDIALGWYNYILRRLENFPDWLKEDFAPYIHASFIENLGNQIKARYHYLTKNYQPLLLYIEALKQRESFLFGRIEMLALEACARYQMKDRSGAFRALQEASEMASPNDIVMPFFELGKDMRTLTLAALRDKSQEFSKTWLQTINRKSNYYATYQAAIIAEYKKKNGINYSKPLSPREVEVLHDLCNGLSRSESADKQGISVSTVKMNINHISAKLNAKNTADIIRIAAEQKLL